MLVEEVWKVEDGWLVKGKRYNRTVFIEDE